MTAAPDAATPLADDAALARLMSDAGIAGSPGDLRSTLARVAASPEPYPADAWLGLVAPDADAVSLAAWRAPAREPAEWARLAEEARASVRERLLPSVDVRTEQALGSLQ